MSTLKKNIIYNSVYQILILFLPFITAPYLSRTIGANGIGVYSFSQSIALYFTHFVLLGLNNYGNRIIASVQDDKDKRSKFFWEIFSMQLITFFISLFLYLIYLLFFAVDQKSAIIMIIWVFSSLFDINWFFFGMEMFKITVMRNTVIKILTVICIFLFVKNSKDIYTYILIMALGTFLSQICLWSYLKKEIVFIKPLWKDIRKHFKPNLVLFIPVIAVSIYKIMDKVMLGFMTNMLEVGYYENAEKIINMVQSLIVAIGTVMLPRMAVLFSMNSQDKTRKYIDVSMEVVLFYVFAVIFGLLSVKGNFVEIYFGNGFEKTSILLGILAFTIFFFGCGNVLRTLYLIPRKLDSIYIKSAIIGAIVNIVINVCLIPRFLSIGAALGTVGAEMMVCIYQFHKVRRDINIRRYLPSVIVYFLSGLFMYTIIRLLPKIENSMFEVIIDIVIGAIIYIGISGVYAFIRIKRIQND